LTSDQRFDAWSKSLQAIGAKDPTSRITERTSTVVKAKDGTSLGKVALERGKLSFQAEGQATQFTEWLHENANTVFPQLHEEFRARSAKPK
jgi:ParB family chromosome partitioning protein